MATLIEACPDERSRIVSTIVLASFHTSLYDTVHIQFTVHPILVRMDIFRLMNLMLYDSSLIQSERHY